MQQSNPVGSDSYGTSSDLDSRRDDYNGSSATKTTSGPHNSDMLNKLDPRVDSDNSKAYDSSRNTTGGLGSDNYGSNTTGGLGSHTTSSGYGSNTSGPHSSDLSNRADPRVDSDNSRLGGSHNTSGLGSTGTTTGAYGSSTGGLGNTSSAYGSNTSGPHSSDLSNRADPRVDSDNSRLGGSHNTSGLGSSGTTTGAYGSSNTYDNTSSKTTSGPHNSDLLNKADPRVDSDNSKAYGSSTHNTSSGLGSSTHHNTGAGFGTTGATTGPHPTDTGNALDPRVDSDRSGYTGSNTTSGLGNTSSGYGSSTTGTTSYGSNTTSGPHSSNLANKADPRVDSDNSKAYDSHNTTSGLGPSGTTTGAYGSTNSGPHSSNLSNKADPRIDSDNDRLRGPDSARDNYGVSTKSTRLRFVLNTNVSLVFRPRLKHHRPPRRFHHHWHRPRWKHRLWPRKQHLRHLRQLHHLRHWVSYLLHTTLSETPSLTKSHRYGNKTSDHTDNNSKNDSTMGKLMEKAGGMLKNENIVEKGRLKREEAGARPEDTY